MFFNKKNKFSVSAIKVKLPFKKITRLLPVIIAFTSLMFFLYSHFYKVGIEQERQRLESEINSLYDGLDIDSMTKLINIAKKLDLAQDVINNHIILSPVIAFIEKNTVSVIKYQSFAIDNSSNEEIVVNLTGSAPDLDSLAQQTDEFSKHKEIKEQLFSNVSRTEDDYNFSLVLKFFKEPFLYVKQ